MRCDEARQLFDAYLDGELAGTLATEFAAHRVRCAACRRDLALLEVTGHVLATDRDAVAAPNDFTDRLLACMDARSRGLTHRVVRWAYVAGPLAAAAVILLAFLGIFDRKQAEVAGEKVVRMRHVASGSAKPSSLDVAVPADLSEPQPEAVHAMDEWIERTRQNLAVKRRSAASIQEALDTAAKRWIDLLDRANSGAMDDAGPIESVPSPVEESSTTPARDDTRPDVP